MSFELVGIDLVAQDYKKYMAELASADKATLSFGDTSSNTFKQMPGLADIATGALHRVGAMAIEVFAQAGQAAVGFIKDSIGVAGDFESGMNKFAAVAGGALEESGLALKDFRDQFIQIGKELPVSTSEVQDAAIEMVKGGIEPATIAAGGLKQVIQFAAAADLDLAEASTIAAKALGGWVAQTATAQEKADFLTHSTDLLSRAANASTVNVDDLALGLYNVQGTAKLAGVSFDETVTALAQLAPSFSSSADAGTSFKTFLSRLQPQTKSQASAMKALGLYTEETGSVFYDAQGNFVGMAKAQSLLHDATKDLTEEQRVNILQTIFGQDAIRTAAVFAEQGADGYNAMTAALEKQNSVQDMAKQKQAGFNTALDNFKGSVEALQITIGSVLLPVLTDLFNNYLAPGINMLTDLSGALSGDNDAFARLSPTMQTVAMTITDLVTQGQTFLASLEPVATFIGENLTPILFGLGTAIAVAVIPPLLTATAALIAAAAPIVALIAVSALLYKGWTEDWGGIRTALTDFWDTTGKPIFDELVSWLSDKIPKAIQVVSDFWTNTLWPALQKVWSFISANIIPIFTTVVVWLRDNIPPAIKTLATLWTDTLWPALQKVWKFIDDHIIPIIGALVNVWWALMKKELQILSDIWTNVFYPALEKVYNWFNDKIVPIFDSAGKGATVLGGIIRDTLGPAFTWLKDNVLSPVSDWLGTIGDKIDSLIGWLNDLADTINGLPGLPSEYEGHSPPPMAKWMSAIAEEAQGAALGIGDIASAVANLPASLPGWVSDIGGDLGKLFDSSGAWGNSGGGGGGSSGGSGGSSPWGSGLIAPTANAGLAGIRAGTSSVTNNQQRTASITYNTAVAPPMSQSYAMAQALVGGF